MPRSVVARRSEWPRRRWLWALVSAAVLAAAACADLSGPDRNVRPVLQVLAIDDLATNLRHGGLLYVNGYPTDTTFRLNGDERIPVRIEVSSGDRESLGLYRVFCPPRVRGSGFHCFSFILLMHQGVSALSVADDVAAIGGRFHLVSVSGRIAGVTLFDPQDLVNRARNARGWTGVESTSLSFPFCAPGAPVSCGSRSELTAPMPVDSGAAILQDGTIQVRSGDTLSVSYLQPDGAVLVVQQPVP